MDAEAGGTTIGLSETAHQKLKDLKEQGYFAEMADAYRFAIGLALAHGMAVTKLGPNRVTFLNVGSLDPDRQIQLAVATLREPTDESVYKTAERLAEWGVEELHRRASEGKLSVLDILAEAHRLER